MLHIELCVVYGGEAVASQHRQRLRAGQSRGSSRWWAVTQWADLVLGPAVSSRASNGPSAKFSQSREKATKKHLRTSPGWKHLLASAFTLKTLVGAFSVIVKTSRMVCLQLYLRRNYKQCGSLVITVNMGDSQLGGFIFMDYSNVM